jgi:hypothetical protein
MSIHKYLIYSVGFIFLFGCNDSPTSESSKNLADCNLSEITSSNEPILSFSYDNQDRVTEIIYNYDDENQKQTISYKKDENGNTVTNISWRNKIADIKSDKYYYNSDKSELYYLRKKENGATRDSVYFDLNQNNNCVLNGYEKYHIDQDGNRELMETASYTYKNSQNCSYTVERINPSSSNTNSITIRFDDNKNPLSRQKFGIYGSAYAEFNLSIFRMLFSHNPNKVTYYNSGEEVIENSIVYNYSAGGYPTGYEMTSVTSEQENVYSRNLEYTCN